MARAPIGTRALTGRAVAVIALATVLASRAPALAAGLLDVPGGTPEEVEGWRAVMDGRWLRAREIGEALLGRDPASAAGHFILGTALRRGEGDLARAAYQLDLAVKAWAGRPPPVDSTFQPHAIALLELASTLGELERPAEQLALLEEHDARYTPRRPAARIWPLIKLKRFDEARAAARAAMETNDPRQRKHARADLCGAEAEAGERQRAYEACTEATADFRGDPRRGGQLEFSNAADSALEVYRHDEAERDLKEAIARPPAVGWVNPYQQLAELYLVEGRIPEAIEAVRGAQQLRLSHPASLDQFVQARLDSTLAELFLVAGVGDRAVAAARRAAEQPDRQGHNSGNAAQATAAAALLLSVTLHEQAVRLEEDAVTAGILDAAKLRARAAWGRLESWRARRRATVVLADEAFLARSLRPYYLGVSLMPWMLPEVVDSVGAGVARSAVARARAEDRFPGSEKYFAAWEAEAEFVRGDCRLAAPAALGVADGLPRAEVALSARMHALAAACALRADDDAAATASLLHVLQHDPRLLRRLELQLPVTVDADGSALAGEAARLVARSPRFLVRPNAAFRLALAGGQAPRACLRGPGGVQIACAFVNLPIGTTPASGARLLVARLHRDAFALKADLTQADLTSLDGSPTAARADQKIRSILDRLQD